MKQEDRELRDVLAPNPAIPKTVRGTWEQCGMHCSAPGKPAQSQTDRGGVVFCWSILVKCTWRPLGILHLPFCQCKDALGLPTQIFSRNSPHVTGFFFFLFSHQTYFLFFKKMLFPDQQQRKTILNSPSSPPLMSHYNKWGCFQRTRFALCKDKAAEQLLKDSLLHLHRPKANSPAS